MNHLTERLHLLLKAMQPFDEITLRHDGSRIILITKSTLREEFPLEVLD